jgi:hypothetical protein
MVCDLLKTVSVAKLENPNFILLMWMGNHTIFEGKTLMKVNVQ